MKIRSLATIALLTLALFGASCATTTTSSTTWSAPPGPGGGWAPPPGQWARPGRVESVQEVVHRTQGDPAGGALAGALIGGFLFGGRGPATLIGAAGGAAIGAAASQGSSERRDYQVLVRFDDGQYGMFMYGGYSPFAPGQPVVLTPQGLAPQ
jgi:outer membrane lipoprotein SlyB